MPDIMEDLALLERAARSAGEAALRHFGSPMQVWEKKGLGPVSEADLELDAMLKEQLRSARPDYGWLSEESVDTAARQDATHIFVVDPIDGTRAFLSGDSGFAMALAIVEEDRVTAAVVHLPARRETYTAALGQGARRNGGPIAGSTCRRLDRATVLAAKRQLHPDLWPGGAPPCARHFRSSLAWRLCLIAEGRFDVMVTLRETFDWDVAAGSLIAAEAGVQVSDGHGARLRFNKPEPVQPGVIAAPSALHRQLMALRQPGSISGAD